MKMKILKNILYAVSLAATIGALSSCKKYLDYQSPSKINLEQTFEDLAYTNNEVVGIYNKLCGSNAYGNQLSIYIHLGADDFVNRGASNFDGGGDYAVSNYGAIPSHAGLFNTYTQLYAGIERANIACRYIPASSLYKNGSEAQKRQMKIYYGEALTLRAQFYYELIRNWGDVPASFIPAADLTSQFMTHADRDSTYDRIIDDLRLASELVPWRDEVPDYKSFRITKGAIKGLRARIALTRGGYSLRTDSRKMERRADYQKYYTIAFNECDTIIKSGKHGLNPVYENIFKSLHSATTRYDETNELIFEVAMWGQINDSNLGNAVGLTFSGSPSWGGGGGRTVAVPTYYYDFANGVDIRREATMATYQVKADPTGTINQKFFTGIITFNINKFRKSWTGFDGKTTSSLGVNWPIIRYADILLMYAEAANELQLSGTISPQDALRLVQKRAYGANPLPPTPAAGGAFFDAIVKERLLEFGGEGIRKYDLIRWNLLATKIAETKKKLGMMAMGADPTDNPYANLPQYIYAAPSTFTNTNTRDEHATILLYGGIPDSVLFKPMTVTSIPAAYPNRNYWRQDLGTWTAGVLTSTYINDPNIGYVSKFEANKKELLPYPDKVILEGRGQIKQNFGYVQ
jgi:hypothetical protein